MAFQVCAAQAAGQQQMIATDQQQAQTIGTQIQADATKQQMERQKIQADTQTKIFETMQDVTNNKSKVAGKAAEQVDQLMRS